MYFDSFHLKPPGSGILIFFLCPKNVKISNFWGIFQNLKFKGLKFVPRRRFAKMHHVHHGPVMVAGEPGSVPAVAHSVLCLQLPSLAACKTLGAHVHFQVFKCLRARFLNKRAGPGAGRRRASTGHVCGATPAFDVLCIMDLKKKSV